MRSVLEGVILELFSDWRRTIEELAAIVAIVLASVHAYHLKKQLKHVDEIQKWLPTQPIGFFPSYLRDIVELIRSARKTIVIVCDYPAYGVFSDQGAFFEYCQEIENRIQARVEVSVTCLDEKWRADATLAEFAKHQTDWEHWRKQSEANIRELLRHHDQDENSASAITLEALVELLQIDDDRTLRSTFLNADVKTVSDTVPVYFWLIDGKEAIFSIPSFSDRGVERGFFTRDLDLISGLLDMHSRSLARELSGVAKSA